MSTALVMLGNKDIHSAVTLAMYFDCARGDFLAYCVMKWRR